MKRNGIKIYMYAQIPSTAVFNCIIGYLFQKNSKVRVNLLVRDVATETCWNDVTLIESNIHSCMWCIKHIVESKIIKWITHKWIVIKTGEYPLDQHERQYVWFKNICFNYWKSFMQVRDWLRRWQRGRIFDNLFTMAGILESRISWVASTHTVHKDKQIAKI